MKLTRTNSFQLHSEIYGIETTNQDGSKNVIQKGLIKKGISLKTRKKIEKDLGIKLAEIVNPHNEMVEETKEKVKGELKDLFLELDKIRSQVETLKDDPESVDLVVSAKIDWANKNAELNHKYSERYAELIKEQLGDLKAEDEKAEDLQITNFTDADFVVKRRFDKKDKEGNEIAPEYRDIQLLEEGEEHYALFIRYFLD